MACAGISTIVFSLSTIKLYLILTEEEFITTVIKLPSTFLNVVLNKLLLLEAVLTRFASGRMNLEK